MRSSMWWSETTVHSGGCNSRQAHYAAQALFTWNLDRARGTKATVVIQWLFFFPWGIKAKSQGEIPTLTDTTLKTALGRCLELNQKKQHGYVWCSSLRLLPPAAVLDQRQISCCNNISATQAGDNMGIKRRIGLIKRIDKVIPSKKILAIIIPNSAQCGYTGVTSSSTKQDRCQ